MTRNLLQHALSGALALAASTLLVGLALVPAVPALQPLA